MSLHPMWLLFLLWQTGQAMQLRDPSCAGPQTIINGLSTFLKLKLQTLEPSSAILPVASILGKVFSRRLWLLALFMGRLEEHISVLDHQISIYWYLASSCWRLSLIAVIASSA